MRLEVDHINYIKASFEKMQTKQDLLTLLNYTKKQVQGENANSFGLKHLTWHANSRLGQERYTRFSIKKKSGGERIIYAPKKGLKSLQKMLSLILQCVFEPPKVATGFVKNRCIVDNARFHLRSHYVYNIDLKDFFYSIDQARVWKCLQLKPFNLSARKYSDASGPGLANIIASLCCTELDVERQNSEGKWESVRRPVLPQGAPTSPLLSNLVCQKLDFLLSGVARKFGVRYSRYADDITFSSMHNVYQADSEFLKEIHRIILQQNFSINESKTRLQKQGHRQEVTGLLVNEQANVRKGYIKQLRMWLYYWERYGYQKAEMLFRQQFTASKPINNKSNPSLINVLGGKLDYLRMVKGKENGTYTELNRRFEKLTGKTKKASSSVASASSRRSARKQVGRVHLPILHNPNKLVGLLKYFSRNNELLKYTTHSWDAEIDARMFDNLEEFLSEALISYKSFSLQLKELSENLNGKIYNFLFNKEIGRLGWGEHRIKFGWSSPELLTACSKNPRLNPEDVFLPLQYQQIIDGRTIQKFKQVVDIFKNEIEIRDENDVLEKLIIQKHDKYLSQFPKPGIHNLGNKTFYTDVQWLSKALDLMFENIQKRAPEKVCYSIVDEGPEAYTLEILHMNSFNTGKSISDEKLNLTKGDFSTIAGWLKNLCDWSIESSFKEGNYRINYLSTVQNAKLYQPIDKAEGFKYRMTFYK